MQRDSANTPKAILQQVIDKNKKFFDSGQRFYGGKSTHYATINSVPTKKGEVKYYDNGSFAQSYYDRASKQLGITPQEARLVSERGRISGSGKARDQALRYYQDKSGKLEAEYRKNKALSQRQAISITATKAIRADPPKTVLRSTSDNAEIARANAEQSAYVASLRSGGVGIAEALLKPKTTQTFFKNGNEVSKSETSINAENFFSERGYDISKPELIPDSIFKPEKQLDARAQTKSSGPMGDLNLKANTYEKTKPEVLKKRNEIRKEFGAELIPINDPKITPIIMPKISASGNLEFFGPTDKRKIENFKLMDSTPVTLSGLTKNQFGYNTTTGKLQRLKTVGETTSPEMQFFGQFIQGSRNTFDSYGNMFTNSGNWLTGKPQQPLARPPVQDQFFGALIDSAKNTFEGEGKDGRSKDPFGDFFNTQQKRIDKVGYGQVSGELFTEGLIWATPVGAVGKIPKIARGFFSPTVQATKASKTYTPGGDFMKLEGKTKDVTWSDQVSAFFGTKGPKTKKEKSAPFTSEKFELGRGYQLGKKTKKGKTDSDNFFGSGGSKGNKSKPSDDIGKDFLTKGGGSGQFLIQKSKTIPKTKVKAKKFGTEDFLKLNAKYEKKVLARELAKQKKLTKQKQTQQFFKPLVKQKVKPKQQLKQKQKSKQNFFKPIAVLKPLSKQKQKQKQALSFLKPITQKQKAVLKQTPKLKQRAMIAPIFPYPTSTKPGGGFFPFPTPNRGGRKTRAKNRRRRSNRVYSAWNVGDQVGTFLRGAEIKKSRSDRVFRDLDKRTKKAKKEKDYDYLDFF